MTGIVFDIHRFSLHDGPGIRTTVFLKGCPLRCQWCHNPESFSMRPELAFHEDRVASPDQAAAIREAVIALRVEHSTDLVQVESRAGVCSDDAVEVIGKAMSVDEVLQEVVRDVSYYRNSGGGVTISGGEPLYQPAFTQALLSAARAEGIHTCLDTSGAVSGRRVEDVVPMTDLFLFDYKATDPEEHRRLTGISNSQILENLELLMHMGARVILRCPLVPGVNDSEEHLRGIAALSARFPQIEDIQIMPYHDMGREKYRQIGLEYPLNGLRTTDDGTQGRWVQMLHNLGCTKAHIG